MKYSISVFSFFISIISGYLAQAVFPVSALADAPPADYPIRVYHQKLDYDHPRDQRTFPDRYYVISDYASGPNAPVIFENWGEQSMRILSRKDFESSYMGYLAKILHAHYVTIEHRYFGMSQPFKTMTPEHLRYLRVDYALKDLANLQRHLMHNGMRGKWISYGGSYGGGLAAFYREKFPNLVTGAVAFSPAAHFSVNVPSIDQYTADQMQKPCTLAFRNGVLNPIISAFGHLGSIKAAFHAEDVQDDTDFLYGVSTIVLTAVQFGQTSKMCKALLGSSPLQDFESFVDAFMRGVLSVYKLNFESFTTKSAMSLKSSDYEDGVGVRPWVYLQCTQLGYLNFYNPDPERSVSDPVLEHFGEKSCDMIFGFKHPPKVEVLNDNYYRPLVDPHGASRIVIINETQDPGSSTSISKELGNWTNSKIDVLTVKGGSHCQGAGQMNENDPVEVKNMQNQVLLKLQEWLAKD